MKLVKASIRRYRSIEELEPIDIEQDVTCFVGKNESGKTAVLQALYKSAPIQKAARFDEGIDFPSRMTRERTQSTASIKVTRLTYELADTDLAALETEFGAGCLGSTTLSVETGYRYENRTMDLQVRQDAVVSHLRAGLELPPTVQAAVSAATTISALVKALTAMEAPTSEVTALLARVAAWRQSSVELAIIDRLELQRPAFVYFGDYDVMPGKVSIPHLIDGKAAGTLTLGEEAVLSLLDIAGVALSDFQNPTSHEHLIRDLENASNSISDDVFEYWSQNTNLAVKLNIIAQPEAGAPPALARGPLLQIRVENTRHRVSVPFDERSRGFVWFFSFLAYFSKLEQSATRPLILLLDEPGLNLHATAQADLLRFIDERLAPKHQVLFSTHSPFMVNPHELRRVRTVVDTEARGTVVSADVLATDAETAFPLHAALGIELSQTLFVGPNVVLVEGPADVIYLEVLSAALAHAGRDGLDSRWVLMPVGGAGRLPAFVTLLGANKLNTVVLADSSIGDAAPILRLRDAGRLGAGGLVLLGEELEKPAADIEDLFEPAFYVSLVNEAYAGLLAKKKLTVAELPADERLVRRVERAFEKRELNKGRINHYSPAATLMRGQSTFVDKIDPITLDRAEKVFAAINRHLKELSV